MFYACLGSMTLQNVYEKKKVIEDKRRENVLRKVQLHEARCAKTNEKARKLEDLNVAFEACSKGCTCNDTPCKVLGLKKCSICNE